MWTTLDMHRGAMIVILWLVCALLSATSADAQESTKRKEKEVGGSGMYKVDNPIQETHNPLTALGTGLRTLTNDTFTSWKQKMADVLYVPGLGQKGGLLIVIAVLVVILVVFACCTCKKKPQKSGSRSKITN